jgi:cytochrome d ubiquinol oxidase subunit II
VLSALYLPVLMMLIALVFRGVAFEFRFKARAIAVAVGLGVRAGLLCAAFWQGVILGAIVEGMPLQAASTSAGMFGFFSPFSMLTGVAVVFGYALLGAGWLILKTEGRLQKTARTLARPLVLVVVAFIGLVSAWLPFLELTRHGALVRQGNFLVAVAGAAAGAAGGVRAVARGDGAGPRRQAVHPHPVPVRAGPSPGWCWGSGRTSCRRR